MIDPRFYELTGPHTAKAIAAWAGGVLAREDQANFTLLAPCALSALAPNGLAFWDGAKAGPLPDALSAATLHPAAILVRERDAAAIPGHIAAIHCKNPRAGFALAARNMVRDRGFDGGEPPQIDSSARIWPGAMIGPGAILGADVDIGPNAVIGPGVAIGRRSRIGPGAVIVCALLGDDVTILSSAMIGQAGFGVVPGDAGLIDVPQLGRAILQDRVTIGACTCIDRGALGDTLIGEGSKIDNLTQIGHNVQIGRNVVIAACGGLSGSVTIGDGAMLGGRVGMADHLTVGPGARLGAGSLIMHNIPAGETWGGYPAKPIRAWLREVAWLKKAAAQDREGQ